jgi:hypothetical protein
MYANAQMIIPLVHGIKLQIFVFFKGFVVKD